MARIAVVGQVARDLVLMVDALPEPGGSADVRRRDELLGGKGANQAVACRQLSAEASLVGVVGADDPGDAVLRQAQKDGLDVAAVVRREGADTALLVDVVESGGVRRLLEDVPPGVLLTPEDVRAAAATLTSADAVMVQLQQPGEALVEALRIAGEAGSPVVVDGAPPDGAVREAVMSTATVVRADRVEAALLLGREPSGVDDVAAAARSLVREGPSVVALAAGAEGNVVAWDGGHVVVPLLGEEPVDPTGAGDAFVAALTVALVRGEDARTAAWWASAAAARSVSRVGGRPALDLPGVTAAAREARENTAAREDGA